MSSITINNLVKRYDQHVVLHGINLAIKEGEFIALVGPSGCGKSTLLRTIAGLEDVSGGDVLLGNRIITHLAPKERNMAMVFQNYALYPHLTIRDNLGFALKIQKVAKEAIAGRVAVVAETLGLTSLLDRYPRQLSGGQRQRVAMGRAIIRQPEAFLFDEPLSNLDAKLRVQMRTEIKALHQKLGTTTVYVTHDQIEAMTMADRIVVMRDGVIEQVGTPLELYDHPVNAFVAGFIGSPSMNFIRGNMEVREARSYVTTDDGLRLQVPASVNAAHGQPVWYGARPEHFVIDASSNLTAQVQVVEPTGSETQISVRFGDQDILVIAKDRVQVRPGDQLRIRALVDNAHVFDQHSGIRLSSN